MHAQSEKKSNDSKDGCYNELEQISDHFPKYPIKVMLGDHDAKVWRENIFKPTIGNNSQR